jgi:competence protein ComEA
MGAVHQPGLYNLPPGTRLKKLLAVAGGPTERADLSDINLAAKVIDTATLTIPHHPDLDTHAGTFRYRRSPQRIYNPASYTISGQGIPEYAPDPIPTESTPTTANPSSNLLNLNNATTAQLENLPGVGPKTAAKIIAYRNQQPFASVNDLTNIHGIGTKTLERLSPLVTIQ